MEDAMSRLDSDKLKLAIVLPAITTVVVTMATTGFSQDEGAPKWGKFLPRHFMKDRLLRKPFVNAPEEEVKGLAAKLRARELDIPNRIRAIEYLSTFHCATFPEARAMLVDVMLNDKWEPVRYEAAKALRDMFEECSNGSCNCEECQEERERKAKPPG